MSDAAASARVADHVRAAILAGEFVPGSWIRQEDIAERLGASRAPVREALRMLAAEGLTEHVAHRGARVPRLDARELDVVYRMRERLEPLALAESIDHLDEEDLQRLRDVQEQIESCTDVESFLALDREFHQRSYAGCDVEPLMSAVVRLWNSTQPYRRTFVALGGHERSWVINAEHRLLLDAIERRDAEDAENRLSGHIRRTRIELAGHPELFTAT